MVDDHGEPIGTATRAACHSDPSLVHLSIHVVVLTPDGVLWQLRGPHKDSAPNAWDHACSGHVDGRRERRSSRPAASSRRRSASRWPTADLEELTRVRCELVGETELTTVFRLRHAGPYRLAPPELAGLAVLPTGSRPSPLSPSALLLNARLDASHPGWDRP